MRRIAITGIGVVTSIGIGKETFWSNLLAGQQGINEVTSFNTEKYRVHRGGEIKDFDFEAHEPTISPVGLGRATQFALVASGLALADAGLEPQAFGGARAGVVMGTTSGEPGEIERFNDCYTGNQMESIGSELMGIYPCHNIPSAIAAQFGLYGQAPIMIPSACAAGNFAVAHAWESLRSGRVDMMLAGGSDAFSRITYTGFARLMAIAPDVCRPFDKNRKGMIPGEGAGMVVLEPLDKALARGAPIYAEVAGYGLSCDAHHMTASHPEGRGAVAAMKNALSLSGVSQIDYISAHGTGTPSNDRNETLAVKKVFGDRAYQIPISSIKSMLGHTMGAASAIETAVCALAIRDNMIPPTMNMETADPACDLDYVPNQARQITVKTAMNNAYAFGGANASVILKQVELGEDPSP